eukprot:7363781-Prymnesium_polylepis.1
MGQTFSQVQAEIKKQPRAKPEKRALAPAAAPPAPSDGEFGNFEGATAPATPTRTTHPPAARTAASAPATPNR